MLKKQPIKLPDLPHKWLDSAQRSGRPDAVGASGHELTQGTA